jgi:hypothetical protein
MTAVAISAGSFKVTAYRNKDEQNAVDAEKK